MARVELSDVVLKKLRDWVRFVGPARVAGGAVSLLLLAGLVAWMFLPPAPPVELSVPQVSVGSAEVDPTVASPLQIRVHVAGSVRHPGVYTLRYGQRVVDAVQAAGGPMPGADVDAINMAQTVKDAEQVYVPRASSASPRRAPSPRLRPHRVSTVTTVAPAQSAATSTGGPVNINTATAAQLDALPGVGPATAKAIISYRSSKGPFAKVDDLLNVPGIGPAKLDAMRRLITA